MSKFSEALEASRPINVVKRNAAKYGIELSPARAELEAKTIGRDRQLYETMMLNDRLGKLLQILATEQS